MSRSNINAVFVDHDSSFNRPWGWWGWMKKYNFFNSSTDGLHEIDLHGSTRQAGRPCVCWNEFFSKLFPYNFCNPRTRTKSGKTRYATKYANAISVFVFYNNRLSDHFRSVLYRGLSGFHGYQWHANGPEQKKNAFWSDRKRKRTFSRYFSRHNNVYAYVMWCNKVNCAFSARRGRKAPRELGVGRRRSSPRSDDVNGIFFVWDWNSAVFVKFFRGYTKCLGFLYSSCCPLPAVIWR